MTPQRILVVGGSGVIGRALLPRLVGAGHRVTVLARSDASAQAAAVLGAVPARGDMFAPATLRAAAADQDVVVHLATRIPRAFPGKPADFAENDRIRYEGTRNLLAAAEATGVRRVVLQSIIWVHGDHGDNWIDESATIRPSALTRSAVDMEAQGRAFVERTGAQVATLRCGSLYAADAWHTREIVRRLRGRTLPIVGGGDNFQGFVHADDAGAAFALAAAADGPGGTWFVVDDEPVRMADFLRWVAQASGADAPLNLPSFLARLALGAEMEAAYGSSLRCRNDAIKAALGWGAKYATFREGYAEVLPRIPETGAPGHR